MVIPLVHVSTSSAKGPLSLRVSVDLSVQVPSGKARGGVATGRACG